jgi:hypothetical protein
MFGKQIVSSPTTFASRLRILSNALQQKNANNNPESAAQDFFPKDPNFISPSQSNIFKHRQKGIPLNPIRSPVPDHPAMNILNAQALHVDGEARRHLPLISSLNSALTSKTNTPYPPYPDQPTIALFSYSQYYTPLAYLQTNPLSQSRLY